MEEEPKKDPNEWALAYGDMITLLMTFFCAHNSDEFT